MSIRPWTLAAVSLWAAGLAQADDHGIRMPLGVWSIDADSGQAGAGISLRHDSGSPQLRFGRAPAWSNFEGPVGFSGARRSNWLLPEQDLGRANVGLAIPYGIRSAGGGRRDADPELSAYLIEGSLLARTNRFASFASMGWAKIGDTPSVAHRDPWFAKIGGSYRFTQTLSGALAYDYRQRLSVQDAPLSELSASLTRNFGQGLKVQGYLTRGFTELSPEWGAGAVLSVGF